MIGDSLPASPSFGPVLAQGHKAGIIVATMYGADTKGVDFNMGPDWTALGKMYVDSLKGRSGPQRLGLLAVAPTGTGKAWIDGVKAAAKKTKNVTVVGIVDTNDDPAKALDQSTALLNAHPEINVLASHMGTATTPMVSVIKQKKLKGKVIVLANGASGGGTDGAKQGVVYKFLMQNLCAEGKDAANAAADIKAGKKIVKQIDVHVVMATLANYKKYGAKGWA